MEDRQRAKPIRQPPMPMGDQLAMLMRRLWGVCDSERLFPHEDGTKCAGFVKQLASFQAAEKELMARLRALDVVRELAHQPHVKALRDVVALSIRYGIEVAKLSTFREWVLGDAPRDMPRRSAKNPVREPHSLTEKGKSLTTKVSRRDSRKVR